MNAHVDTCRAKGFSDDIRGNWGFHDARADMKRGMPRRIVDRFPANATLEERMRHVSREFDPAYAAGYERGLCEVAK